MASKKKVRAGEEFVFCNGATAATVAQLRKEIEKLTSEQFEHHVNSERNDVYTWIHDCLDEPLAGRIREVRDRKALLKALLV